MENILVQISQLMSQKSLLKSQYEIVREKSQTHTQKIRE